MKKSLSPNIRRRFTVLLPLALLVSGCKHGNIGQMEFHEGEVQHAVLVGDVPWGPCPPHLPAGCEIAVLEGNPQAEGIFTVRFRVDAGFVMAPHTHPNDERVTVLTGKVAVGFGPDASREDANVFGPGDYYVNARDAIHTVWADEPSIVQVTGMGPWEAHFVDDENGGKD